MNASDASSSRKRFSIWLWLVLALGAYVLFVVVRLFGLFNTGPVIEIGPETTVLTSPVREDGSIDYVAALDTEFSNGLTFENNAAVLLVQAFGTEIFDSAVRQQSLEKLGFVEESSIERPFIDDEQFFKEQGVELDFADPVAKPWTRDEQPVMAKWLDANQDALDVIVKATQRERYYTPLVRATPTSTLIECFLPVVQWSRSATRALVKRAMLRLSEGEIDSAFEDTLAVFRMSRLIGKHPTLIGRLVAFAHNAMATECLAQIIQSGKATRQQIDEFADEFSVLDSIGPMHQAINGPERFVGLEMAQNLALQRMPQGVQVPSFALRTIDANVMMRVINEAYDEFVAAMEIESYQDRSEELARIEQSWTNKASRTSLMSLMLGSRSAVSTSIANLLVSITLPASAAISESETRMHLKSELAKVLIALGKHRAETGEFPQTLDELVPTHLKTIPVDRFSGSPIQYERFAEGAFQLTSAGPDGVVGEKEGESDDIVLPEPDDS